MKGPYMMKILQFLFLMQNLMLVSGSHFVPYRVKNAAFDCREIYKPRKGYDVVVNGESLIFVTKLKKPVLGI